MTQLRMEAVKGAAPLQSEPVAASLDVCPVRDRCMVTSHVKGKRLEDRVVQKPRSELGIPCGFEQARNVAGCRKRQGLEK